MPVQCTCRHCDAAFALKPSAIRNGQGVYCSHACKSAGQRRTVDRQCEQCGAAFTTRPCYIDVGGGKYCSHPCYAAALTQPIEVRFWAKVQKSAGCWTWTANRLPKGYGVIGAGGQGAGMRLAHRVSWEIHNGPIPDGLWVLHRCDNPPCVRPGHLFLGTVQDNVDDMIAKGRARFRGNR